MIYEVLLQKLDQNKDKEIYFWGASKFLENFLSKNDVSKYKIRGIFDSDEKRWKEKLFGYEVLKFENINKENTVIIPTIVNNHARAYNSIYNTLKSRGFEKCLLSSVNCSSNKIYFVDKTGKKTQVTSIPGICIKWEGINSTVEIECNPKPKFYNVRMLVGSNVNVKVASSVYDIRNLDIEAFDSSEISIGKNFSCEQLSIWMTCEQGKKVIIGDECMFSTEIMMRTSDAHAIIDKATKKVINEGKDIIIGNHVWMARRVTVLKGSNIPDGCVIGTNSLVSKKLKEKDAVYAGSPAKIIKKNIVWTRESIDTYKKYN